MPNITGLAAISLADNNAAGFTSVPASTTQAVLTVEDNAIRIGSVDSPPTATTGDLNHVGDKVLFVGNNYGDFLRQLRIINNTPGSNGTLKGFFMSGYDRA